MPQFDIALVAYAPDGARLGPLPAPLRITSATNPLNDLSGLQFDYLEAAPGFSHLKNPIELAVEVYNPSTGAWSEPYNSRYLLIDWDANSMDETGKWSFTCPGYAYLMDKVITRPRSRADISGDITSAKAIAASARIAYDAAKATLRTAAGTTSKAGVIFSDYEPEVVHNAVWVDSDASPKTVWKGNRPNKKESGSWVARTGSSVVAAADAAYEAKLVYDDANAGITRAQNDKSFDREIANANAGRVMNQLLTEAQARANRLPGLSWDFTATHDSNGQPWAITFDVPLVIKAGQSAYSVLEDLTGQGLCDWVMEGRTLHLYNPDTALLRDRTGTQLLAGTDFRDAPDKGTYGGLTHNILFLGEEGTTFEMNNSAPISPWGRWEKGVSQGGVTSRMVGQALGQAQLDIGAGPRTEATRELVFQPGRPLPYLTYRAGDNITAIGGGGTPETLRVRQITLTRDNTGLAAGNIVLGDRFLEAEVRQRRKVDGILNGTVPDGNGTLPGTPVVPAERRPEAPHDLVAIAQNYFDTRGKTIGRLLIDWTWDGVDTNGTLIELNGYQVQIRSDRVNEPWASARSVPETTLTLDDVRVKSDDGFVEVYQLRVRAIAYNGRTSDWSEVITVAMGEDFTPPPVPSALFVQSISYGTAPILGWDGEGAGGEPMPLDFNRVEGEIATDPLGPWTLFGNFQPATTQAVPFELFPGPHWVRARSFDHTGNASEYSELTPFELKPFVELPDVHDLIEQINTDIEGVQESANGRNRIQHSLTDPVIDGKEVEGDVWWKWTASKRLIGQWTWTSGAWAKTELSHEVIASVDLGKATVGMLDGIYIKARTINTQHLIIGDMPNMATIDADWGVNVTVPAACATFAEAGYTRKSPGGNDILLFGDQGGPVPVESGDYIRVSFDAVADTAATAKFTLWVYPNTESAFGALSASSATLNFTTTQQHYSLDLQVPDLSSIGGGKSFAIGLAGAGVRYIGVRNTRVYKKVNATYISPDSIRTSHLGADIIESHHIKANTIEGSRMKAGFADFIVMTGSLVQTVSQANRGIKLDGGTNSMYGYNVTGDRVFYMSANNGDIEIGKGKTFQVSGSTGSLNIGNGKMTVNGVTGAIDVKDAAITGATINGGAFHMIGTGAGVGFDVHVVVDGYGMSAIGLSTRDSDTNATIRAHQVGAEGGASGDEYDQGPAVKNGATQLVIRSPRRTGVTTDRCVLWLQSWEGNNGAFDQPRLAIRGDILFTGSAAVRSRGYLAIDSAFDSTLDIGINAAGVRSTVIRDRPYTAAANVYVTSNGFLGQTSSASRFKLDQRVADLPDSLLDIPVKDWIDRTSFEEAEELWALGVRSEEQQRTLSSGDQDRRIPGVVAEDVAANGGSLFVTYNLDGEIQGVAYDRLAIAQIAVLARKVRALEEQLRNG